jgi:hypothetical protein
MRRKAKNKQIVWNKKGIIITLAVLCVLGISYYIYSMKETEGEGMVSFKALTKEYVDDEYKFKVNIPDDFSVRKAKIDEGSAIVFENEKAQGVQIMIRKYDDPALTVLSSEMIQSGLPDMQILDPQVLEIGMNHKGVAFRSDNEAFDGASREVWFIFRGNLYQISTYEKFDDLLKQIFGTWTFS